MKLKTPEINAELTLITKSNPIARQMFYCRGEADKHSIGKHNTQKIERKNLNYRTWVKRLQRKTTCFSKSEFLHNTVIGLQLINVIEFERGFLFNYSFDPLP